MGMAAGATAPLMSFCGENCEFRFREAFDCVLGILDCLRFTRDRDSPLVIYWLRKVLTAEVAEYSVGPKLIVYFPLMSPKADDCILDFPPGMFPNMTCYCCFREVTTTRYGYGCY